MMLSDVIMLPSMLNLNKFSNFGDIANMFSLSECDLSPIFYETIKFCLHRRACKRKERDRKE